MHSYYYLQPIPGKEQSIFSPYISVSWNFIRRDFIRRQVFATFCHKLIKRSDFVEFLACRFGFWLQRPASFQSITMEISSAVNKTSHAERTPRGVVIDRSMKLEPIIDHATHNPNTAPWSGHALGMVFDLLTDPKDLVACACVCKSWCAEIASSDHLFKAAWTREISEQGLWRWYRAAGGYREQLRADSVVRKGKILNGE